MAQWIMEYNFVWSKKNGESMRLSNSGPQRGGWPWLPKLCWWWCVALLVMIYIVYIFDIVNALGISSGRWYFDISKNWIDLLNIDQIVSWRYYLVVASWPNILCALRIDFSLIFMSWCKTVAKSGLMYNIEFQSRAQITFARNVYWIPAKYLCNVHVDVLFGWYSV